MLTFFYLVTGFKTQFQLNAWNSYTLKQKLRWFWLFLFKSQKKNQSCGNCACIDKDDGPFCSCVFGIEGLTSEIGDKFWCENYVSERLNIKGTRPVNIVCPAGYRFGIDCCAKDLCNTSICSQEMFDNCRNNQPLNTEGMHEVDE